MAEKIGAGGKPQNYDTRDGKYKEKEASKREDLIKKYSSDPGKESIRIDRTIRHLEKRINEHKDKILNPEKYIIDWDKRSEVYKKGIKKYWKKEIINYYNQINKIRG